MYRTGNGALRFVKLVVSEVFMNFDCSSSVRAFKNYYCIIFGKCYNNDGKLVMLGNSWR